MHPGQARYWLHNRQSLLARPLWFLQTKHSRELTMWVCLSATNTWRYAWALLKKNRESSQCKLWIVCWPKEPVAPIPILLNILSHQPQIYGLYVTRFTVPYTGPGASHTLPSFFKRHYTLRGDNWLYMSTPSRSKSIHKIPVLISKLRAAPAV